MNILHIPSWYPNEDHAYNGIFIKEQINAFCVEKDIQSYVVLFHEGNINIPFITKAKPDIKTFYNYLINPEPQIQCVKPGFNEIYVRYLQWTGHLGFKLMDVVFKAVEHAFQFLIKRDVYIDIIHAHVSYPAGYLACLLAKKYQIPYIISEHMGPFPFDSYLKNTQIRNDMFHSLNNAKKIVAVSKYQQMQIESYNFENVEVIPNVVDEDEFDIIDLNPKKNQNEFVFLTIAGNLSREKGIEDLINAVSKLQYRTDKPFILKIAGENEANKNLWINLIHQLDLTAKIAWLGNLSRREVVTEMQQCDCFVLPSWQESFGVVYVEALACGKPVIATDCGGPKDIVNEHNGFLIPVGNVKQLASAMNEIIYEFENYDSNLIRQDCLNRFSKKIIAREYKRIYNEVRFT